MSPLFPSIEDLFRQPLTNLLPTPQWVGVRDRAARASPQLGHPGRVQLALLWALQMPAPEAPEALDLSAP